MTTPVAPGRESGERVGHESRSVEFRTREYFPEFTVRDTIVLMMYIAFVLLSENFLVL